MPKSQKKGSGPKGALRGSPKVKKYLEDKINYEQWSAYIKIPIFSMKHRQKI